MVDKIKLPITFPNALRAVGIDVIELLRRSGLSPALWQDGPALVTPAQLCRIWTVLGTLSPDPALGLKLPRMMPAEIKHPASIAAQHARNFRDALQRFARYKLLCCGEELRIEERDGQYRLAFGSLQVAGPIPPMMIDVMFSSALELGRLGTRCDIHPLRVELSQGIASRKVYESYYVRILLRLSGPL